MSAKHKISQNDLRKFMSQHKQKKLETVKKIESPLAKYMGDGTIKCILCDNSIKNEALWTVHINAKIHKENIAKKKQAALSISGEVPATRVPSLPNSRAQDVPSDELHSKRSSDLELPPAKKLKGILKNSNALPEPKPSIQIQPKEDESKVIEMETENTIIPTAPSTSSTETAVPLSDLPEGFFDNPLLDAKARNVEYKDPIEEEWERFQKEMKEEVSLSTRLMEDESETATVERQIVEVDEQLKNWSRVVDLEKKKENLETKLTTQLHVKKEEPSESSGEEDLDEFVNWRNKQSFS